MGVSPAIINFDKLRCQSRFRIKGHRQLQTVYSPMERPIEKHRAADHRDKFIKRLPEPPSPAVGKEVPMVAPRQPQNVKSINGDMSRNSLKEQFTLPGRPPSFQKPFPPTMSRSLQPSQGWQLEAVRRHGNEILSLEQYAARGVRTTARDPTAVDPQLPLLDESHSQKLKQIENPLSQIRSRSICCWCCATKTPSASELGRQGSIRAHFD
jgi:hypothetical protein